MINGHTLSKHTFTQTHPFPPHNKTNPRYQITVTQHNVRLCGVSVCKVSGGWSCKDVDGRRHRASLIWQGHLLLLTEERDHSIKLDGNLEPKLSHVPASDRMNSLNNESIWDLWVTARWAPFLTGHRFLIRARSTDSRPLCGCSQSYIQHLFNLSALLSVSDGSSNGETCPGLYLHITVRRPCCQEDRTVEDIFRCLRQRNNSSVFCSLLANFSALHRYQKSGKGIDRIHNCEIYSNIDYTLRRCCQPG